MSFQATTIVAVRKDGKTAIAGDGRSPWPEHHHEAQCGQTSFPGRWGNLSGFAGSAADAFTLFEKFEASLKTTPTS